MTLNTNLGSLGFIAPALLAKLRAFPEAEFGQTPSRRWLELCDRLDGAVPSTIPWKVPASRKWELVSGLQKVIRRGDRTLALHLIAAVEGMPDEWPYFWRRLPIIACEDIGQGDPDLTAFVVACSQLFTPVKAKSVLPTLSAFLVSEMASIPTRSRTACSLAGIHTSREAGQLARQFTQYENVVLSAIEGRVQDLQRPNSLWRAWQRQNDWRGARLLRLVDLSLPFEPQQVRSVEPHTSTLCGLPSFSYDMYSRIGRSVLRRLVYGAKGALEIRDFFRSVPSNDPVDAAGEALFFCEGGLLSGEVVYEPVIRLRHEAMALQFGMPCEAWSELRRLVAEAVGSGFVDQLRAEELDRRSAQGELFGE